MQCPKCENAISEGTVHGEPVDKCKKCGGIWISTGELRAFFERILEGAPTLRGRKVDPSKAPPVSEFYRQGRDCPACGQQMTKTYYAYDSGIPIEHCEPCGGTWIDKPQIDQLAKYIRDDTAPIVYRDATGEVVPYEAKPLANVPSPLENRWLLWFMVAMGFAVVGYGGFRLYPVMVALKAGEESQDWAAVEGTILDSSRDEISSGWGGRDKRVFILRTRYAYDYERESYENDDTWPNGDDFMTNQPSDLFREGLTRQFSIDGSPNDSVRVFVDPENPARSCLNRGTNPYRERYQLPRYRNIAIGGGVVVVLALGLLVRLSLMRSLGR